MVSDPTILSGSSLNTWNECPKEWEYIYLQRLERVPSLKMAIGTAAHYAVEVAMKYKLKHGEEPPPAMWMEAFHKSWDEETEGVQPRNDKPEESVQAHYASGINCITFYATEVSPTIVPFAVEMPIRFTINGYTWTGTADLLEAIDGDPTRIRLRDHKFTSKRPDSKSRYRWPMIGYAIGLRQQLGLVEEDVQLDYIIRNKKPIHFPVANGGPISDQDILDLAQEVENAMTAIKRGSFPPLGRDTGACNWCPFWAVCDDYKGNRKKE